MVDAHVTILMLRMAREVEGHRGGATALRVGDGRPGGGTRCGVLADITVLVAVDHDQVGVDGDGNPKVLDGEGFARVAGDLGAALDVFLHRSFDTFPLAHRQTTGAGPRDFFSTHLIGPRNQHIPFVERIGTLEALEVQTPIGAKVARRQSLPLITLFLILIAVVVGVVWIREGFGINPSLSIGRQRGLESGQNECPLLPWLPPAAPPFPGPERMRPRSSAS